MSLLTHWCFSSILFQLYVIGFFFSFLFLWLIPSFMPLWPEKMFEIIAILLHFLRLVLRPSMGSILGNIPCTLERMCIMGFFWGGVCNIPKMSIKSNCSIVSSRICVAILIFSLEDLSSGVLVSCYIPISFSLYVFNIYFVNLISPILGTYMSMPKKL